MLPTTKVYKLDLQYIADNALNRKLWGKKWTIFEYDQVRVELFLSKIDIKRNQIRLSLSLITKDKGTYNGGMFSWDDIVIPLRRSEQNMDNALRQIVSKIRTKLFLYEEQIASGYVGYQRAKEYDDALYTHVRNKAIALLDEEEITNEDIREAYIDSCTDKFETDNAYHFLQSSRYKTRPHYYLMLVSFFYPNDKEKYEDILSTTGINTETKTYERYASDIKEYLKAVYEDDVDGYLESMDFELEDIKGVK